MGIIDLPGARLRFRRKTDDLTRESSWHAPDPVLDEQRSRVGRDMLAGACSLGCLSSEPGDQDIFLCI